MVAAMPAFAAPPGVDSPELSAPGPMAVGYRALTLVHSGQPNLLDKGQLEDRTLVVDLWYPAQSAKQARPVTYHAQLWGEPPNPPKAFSLTGVAVQGARPVGTRHPLVILSHGYSNAPMMLSWLTENLATKGYVVAAIRHRDPNPYVAAAPVRAAPFYYRPTDISFVARTLRSQLGSQIDPDKVALIGYSQGGYGVITAGGASLDPAHPLMGAVVGDALKSIARGGAAPDTAKVPGVKAIIALAPTGGGTPDIWGDEGLAAIKAPLLLIAGDADPVVGYEHAARSFFERATQSDRYLLTYKLAGHQIATNPVPADMRGTLWDMDWFEDPIWRQDRLNAINLHFVTAFLGMTLKGEDDKRAFLDVPVVDSDQGKWQAPKDTPWSAYSPGGAGVTLWKGFQQRHGRGMRLEHLSPSQGSAKP
ncbi:MAG: alpha/beta hydrolase family protein [Chakrabartia sp.]